MPESAHMRDTAPEAIPVEAPPPESLTIPKIRPLVIWAVSDGRAGIKNQALGLAEAVARKLDSSAFEPLVVTRDIAYRKTFDRWPTALRLFPDQMLKRSSDPLEAPWPDLWIGCGRASLPHSLRMQKRSKGKTMVVQLQDPRTSLRAFDLVVAPEHDQVRGDNVLSIIGSTNRVTPEKLAGEHELWRDRLSPFKGPFVTVLIGGASKTHSLSEERADVLGQQIKSAIRSIRGTLLLTFSRRTPEPARAALKAALKDLPGIIYDGEGDNPYFAFLSAADHILVTEDSVNMVVEAAATGKPIYILGLERKSGLNSTTKFDQFHLSMQQKGATRPFSGDLRGFGYTPLAETSRAADAIVERLKARRPGL
jgi:uncharacterized protein